MTLAHTGRPDQEGTTVRGTAVGHRTDIGIGIDQRRLRVLSGRVLDQALRISMAEASVFRCQRGGSEQALARMPPGQFEDATGFALCIWKSYCKPSRDVNIMGLVGLVRSFIWVLRLIEAIPNPGRRWLWKHHIFRMYWFRVSGCRW